MPFSAQSLAADVKAAWGATAASRRHLRGQPCEECARPADRLSALGWCGSHYRIARKRVLKATIVQAMGGRCEDCGGTFPQAALDLHHLGQKGGTIAAMMKGGQLSRLTRELMRCKLLCANCHRIHHNDQ